MSNRHSEHIPAASPGHSAAPDRIVLIGVNHETAPVALREKLAFAAEDIPAAVRELVAAPAVNEALLFSTCNRVEILLVAGDASAAAAAALDFLCRSRRVGQEQLLPVLYRYEDDEAVRHIFRVASGLDSLVVGEPQVFGQVKEAYRLAVTEKTTGVILNRLIHRTFSVAKRVRHETGIGDSAVSISYAAIELGRKIFGSLEGRQVLLVGAGEMAELAVAHLVNHDAGTVFVANRTFERAVHLARSFVGQAVRLEEIDEALKSVDIVVSSTGSPELVVRADQVKKVMRSRRNRPVFFIDIAVPRDIDPAINRLDNAYVYDIDDLKGVVDENLAQRKKEAVKAGRIVDEAVIRFRTWYESLEVVPTVVALREKLSVIAAAEVEKTLHSLDHPSENDRAAVRRMAEALVNKIVHDPTVFLKQQVDRKSKHYYLDTLKKLFRLDTEE
ncbi:MAG: glutamyl-tRNA reductase [Desulfosudaceae bacterium]